MVEQTTTQADSVGRVYLVGAGPGDPALITLRGVELLRRADAILYDYLANPQLLEHAGDDALLQCVGKHGGGSANPAPVWTQGAINERMIELAREGKRVVRLKGGDPSIFARASDETEALDAAGIPFEIIPGVTAAMAAAAYAATSLTDRRQASAVALVTGREADKANSHLDFQSLANFPGVVVFYMGVVSVGRWSGALLQAGKPPHTPCSIVRRASLPDQQTWHCRLDEVARLVEEHQLRPPILFVVGREAMASKPDEPNHDSRQKEPANRGWFQQRPLFGQRVLVTRPRQQSDEVVRLLTELGAETLLQPVIELTAVEGRRREMLDDALSRLERFDWVVFSSSNGVRFTVERLKRLERDAREFGACRLAAVGKATAAALKPFFLRADLVAASAQQEGLAEALLNEMQQADSARRVLLLRASRGRDLLAQRLQQDGCEVEQVVAYESRDVQRVEPRLAETLAERPADWILAASSASAESAWRLFSESCPQARWAAISQLTADRLRELGADVAATATAANMPALVASIRRAAGA